MQWANEAAGLNQEGYEMIPCTDVLGTYGQALFQPTSDTWALFQPPDSDRMKFYCSPMAVIRGAILQPHGGDKGGSNAAPYGGYVTARGSCMYVQLADCVACGLSAM